MTAPLVVKLGGDALASPAQIVAQASRLARWAAQGPIVVVASARRGVTDHLLELITAVGWTIRPERDTDGAHTDSARGEAERALATGEVVSASLLALALNELGVRAVSLDAREAGVIAGGEQGHARIERIDTGRLEELLAAGVVPVVTGFQGWREGRVTTLGRGGSDISAVALAVALGAGAVRFVKDTPGIRTADPKLVSHTVAIPEAPHHFLTALTRAGSRILHPDAAELAERHRLPLEFWSLEGDRPESLVHAAALPTPVLRAATYLPRGPHPVTVSVLGVTPTDLGGPHRLALAAELQATGLADVTLEEWAHGFQVQAPAPLAGEVLKTLHRVVVRGEPRCRATELRAS